MITVIDSVRTILVEDDIALQAMQQDLLNMSAFAEKIHTLVEHETKKEVQKGTIVVALSRIAREFEKAQQLKPEVTLNNLSIKAPLFTVSYEKTLETLRATQELFAQLKQGHEHFLTLTQGNAEITIIASEELRKDIEDQFKVKPKITFANLVGLTVRFSPKYLEIPNLYYAILAKIAVHHISLIEIVTTYTELSVIVRKEDTEITINALQNFFK